MQLPSQYQPKRLVRPKATADRMGISKTTLYRLIKAGKFPKPIRISDQATGWPEEVIDAWIASRTEG